MIKLENVTLLDKKADSEPINFSNESNITFIPYKDKAIYNLLSIRQQYIKDGNMSIDDFSLFPLKDQKKYAFVLNINSQVISLNAVFVLELSFKDKTRSLLKKDLTTLRNLPLESEEEKKDKINKVFATLTKFECKYVLINLNDEVNKVNENIIKEVVDANTQLTYFYLMARPEQPKPVQAKIEKPIKIKKGDKIAEVKEDNSVELLSPGEQVLADQYKKDDDEEFMTVTRTMPIVTDELLAKEFEDFEKEFSDFNIDIAYKKASVKKEHDVNLNRGASKKQNNRAPSRALVFLKEMFKHLYLYYLFIGLFSIFLSICSFSSVYLINNKNGLIAGILLFLMIVFIFMHMYIIGSTYAGIRKRLKQKQYKVAFVLLYIAFTLIGLGIGLGFIALLSVNDVFVDIAKYKITDWLLGIIVSILALLAPTSCALLGKAYVKLHILFEKLFPNNPDDKD